jgi:CheY-like chemotaxis protein
LAEDMDDSREVTRHVLESMGARVTEARDGNEALESVAARRPDIVLCDLGMPRMDGFTFLRELRRKFGEDLPVVAISGRATDADRERSRAAGFEAHLSKPYDWDKLLAVVGRALRRPPSA